MCIMNRSYSQLWSQQFSTSVIIIQNQLHLIFTERRFHESAIFKQFEKSHNFCYYEIMQYHPIPILHQSCNANLKYLFFVVTCTYSIFFTLFYKQIFKTSIMLKSLYIHVLNEGLQHYIFTNILTIIVKGYIKLNFKGTHQQQQGKNNRLGKSRNFIIFPRGSGEVREYLLTTKSGKKSPC